MKNYDPILIRLTSILGKLNNDERPVIPELAKEFNVSIKTIQNDIYKRLVNIALIKKDKQGRLKFEDGFSLDKTFFSVEQSRVIIKGLDCLDTKCIDNKEFKLIKSIHAKLSTSINNDINISIDSSIVEKLKYSIKNYSCIQIEYIDNDYNEIIIYDALVLKLKIINNRWYTIIKDTSYGNELKIYIDKIIDLTIDNSCIKAS